MRPLPQQVPRLALVFAVAVLGLIVARQILIPDTFGDRGHYRAAAVDSIMAREIKYAGHQECATCHSEIARERLGGNHRGVSCEVCHGPAASHVAAPLDVKPPAPRNRDFCPLCHAYNPSRPTGFPQIDPVAHNPRTPCITCHSPHAPVPPVAPEECGACHGQIARQKAFSPHVGLTCTTCHEAPAAHKTNPRAARPSKPQTREFCTTCHGQDARSAPEIPRIDPRTHGERYTCWQCHYPHYPET
ncbi:MAG TPA: cytochrome c3 family protein [Gemmatimonadales bacterium]|nr:cytochrome c3 family protein [Gemmatimonadales bacterium]